MDTRSRTRAVRWSLSLSPPPTATPPMSPPVSHDAAAYAPADNFPAPNDGNDGDFPPVTPAAIDQAAVLRSPVCGSPAFIAELIVSSTMRVVADL